MDTATTKPVGGGRDAFLSLAVVSDAAKIRDECLGGLHWGPYAVCCVPSGFGVQHAAARHTRARCSTAPRKRGITTIRLAHGKASALDVELVKGRWTTYFVLPSVTIGRARADPHRQRGRSSAPASTSTAWSRKAPHMPSAFLPAASRRCSCGCFSFPQARRRRRERPCNRRGAA